MPNIALPESLPWTPRMVDAFFSAYLECALWSSTDESTEAGGEPLDANYNPEDIPAPCRERLRAECVDFLAAHHETLEAGEWTPEQAGHDFWLTRNGHGAGFWDRGKGQIGQQLTDACKAYGTVDLYVGDDGQVWASGYEA